MWYNPIQSVASTSSFMSHVMTRFWPRFSVYSKVDAVSEDLLWEVTRSVSLLARGRPMGPLTTETVSMAAAPPLSARLRRFSGLRVCRRWGLRLRGADRWSRLPTERFGGLWERVLAGRTAVAREGRILSDGWRGGDCKLKCRFRGPSKRQRKLGVTFQHSDLNHHGSTSTELPLRRCDEMGALEVGWFLLSRDSRYGGCRRSPTTIPDSNSCCVQREPGSWKKEKIERQRLANIMQGCMHCESIDQCKVNWSHLFF